VPRETCSAAAEALAAVASVAAEAASGAAADSAEAASGAQATAGLAAVGLVAEVHHLSRKVCRAFSEAEEAATLAVSCRSPAALAALLLEVMQVVRNRVWHRH